MILWIVLFILVVALSYVLALKSMKDFVQTPEEGSLYLIRNRHKLSEALHFIAAKLQTSNLSISFEKLIKGKKAALVVYGPKQILEKLIPVLDLLELEDYTKKDDEQIWIQLILWGDLNAQIRCILVSTKSSGFSNAQLLDNYQKRSFQKGEKQQSLTIDQVKHFLLQPQQILPQSEVS